MIEFDYVLNHIGHLGRYQILLVLLVYWHGIPAGLHNIASVFYAAPVEFRCNVPPIDNSSVYNLTEVEILNWTTPVDSDGDYDSCYRYDYNLSSCDGTYDCVNKSAGTIYCDSGYYFDTSEFASTVNTEWDLVCENSILSTAATSSYFAGMWAGAIAFGYMSDYLGRRPTMLTCCIGTLIFGIAVAFSPWFAMFVVFRFFVAAFSHGAFLIACVYVMEITGKRRTLTGINAHSAFAVGYMLNSLFSYFLRDWRWFYFAISLTPIPYILFHFFIPESPKFHFSNGRDDKGKELSNKFAEKNGKKMTNDVWKESESDQSYAAAFERTYSSLDLFKSRRMCLITINCMFSWFVVSLVYYGLSLNAGNLAGDIWLNNALNGSMEIFGYIIVTLTMDRWGRRILMSGSLFLSGISCIGSMLFNEFANGDKGLITAGVVMAFIGKIGAGGSFGIVYNYTAELYPTVVRSNGLGVGSMAARWGSILAPFIILIQEYVPWAPSTIFGVLSVIAGALALLFPETMNRTMPETLAEADLFYQGKLEKSKQEAVDSSEINMTFEFSDFVNGKTTKL